MADPGRLAQPEPDPRSIFRRQHTRGRNDARTSRFQKLPLLKRRGKPNAGAPTGPARRGGLDVAVEVQQLPVVGCIETHTRFHVDGRY